MANLFRSLALISPLVAQFKYFFHTMQKFSILVSRVSTIECLATSCHLATYFPVKSTGCFTMNLLLTKVDSD